ncbi:hypothetical protein RB298_04620 [Priestia sp. BR_2]
MKKKKYWYIALILILLIVVAGITMSIIQSKSSFKELVLDHIKDTQEINYINIVKNYSEPDEKEIRITDESTIHDIINSFSDLKLKSTRNTQNPDTTYEIRINADLSNNFTILLTNKNNIRIHSTIHKNKKYQSWYKLDKEYNFSLIEDLLNK